MMSLERETGDEVDLDAHFMQLSLRIRDRAAQTAADDSNLFEAVELALSLPRGADEVVQAVALVQRAERLRGRADLLEDDGDRAVFAVKIRDGERNSLALCADTQDDELTRLGLARNVRRVDDHQLGVHVQRLLFQNLIHS